MWKGGEKITIRKFGLHVVMPIVIGSFIYIMFRQDTLLVFKWIDHVGLGSFIALIRERITLSLPAFVKYSLPDGLWAYAFAYTIYQIWQHSRKIVTHSIIFGIPCIGIGSEVLQIPHLIQGTFDFNDVIAYGLAAVLLYMISKQKGKQITNEKDNVYTTRMSNF